MDACPADQAVDNCTIFVKNSLCGGSARHAGAGNNEAMSRDGLDDELMILDAL